MMNQNENHYGFGFNPKQEYRSYKAQIIKTKDRNMNTTWNVICSAVKASLFNMPVSLPENIDWEEIFAESRKQAIVSIVRDGLKSQLPPEFVTAWKLYSIHDVSHGVQLLEAQNELTILLDENHIHYTILKGTTSAIYYPEPFFRSMGDVDFWVPKEQFAFALEMLEKHGFVEIDGSDSRHLKLEKYNILFEMHRYFSSDERQNAVDRYIEDAELERGKIRGAEFWMLPELENGLVLLVHLRQHLYEGLGLRQVFDWMMYVRTCLDHQGWQKFRPYAKELGLERLALAVTCLCRKYFGLDVDWCGNNDEAAEMLMTNIIQSGNFGHAHGSGRNVERVVVNIKKQGVFHYLQQAGEFNWRDSISTHPYFRPFAWFYQICRYIRQAKSSGRIGSTLKDDLKRSNERYELLKALELL